MEAYIILIVAFVIGTALYAGLRRRDVHPFLSGFAAIAVAMVTTIGYFAFVLFANV